MFFIFIVICVLSFIFYVKWKQTYWQRRGVPFLKPEFFFGNFKKSITKQMSFGELIIENYRKLQKLDSKYAGVYFFWKPLYVPLDPALIKSVLLKDFAYFMNHDMYYHPKDILTMNLINLEGKKWKELRAKLTPTFTSGKMKMMYETILEKAQGLEKVIANYSAKHEAFTAKDVFGRFTTDTIASCAFGIECNSLEEPDNIFRKYGKKVFEPKAIKFLLIGIIPWDLLGNLGYRHFGRDVNTFFTDVVKKIIKSRETNKIFRKDFMHMLLQLKNQGTLEDSAKLNGDNTNKEKKFISENDIIAQSFVFFFAGFETSSTTMTFALLELAQHPDIQQKLREEINKVLEKHDGKITYDAIMEMNYLERVINETLRRYPPVTILPRVCTKDYKVPDSDLVIEKGTKMQIPVWGIHMDPQYYPNPEIFDPERFSEENKATRPDFTFLPFGEGPRMCIGLRFGMLQTKVGLVSVIKNFRFTLNKKTPLPIKMEEGTFVISVKGEVWLDAAKI